MSVYRMFKYNNKILKPDDETKKYLDKVLKGTYKYTSPLEMLSRFWGALEDETFPDKIKDYVSDFKTERYDVDNNTVTLLTISEISFLEYAYSQFDYSYAPTKNIPISSELHRVIRNLMKSYWNGYDIYCDDDVDDRVHDMDGKLYQKLNYIKNSYIENGYYEELYRYLFSPELSEKAIYQNQLNFLSIWMGNSDAREL